MNVEIGGSNFISQCSFQIQPSDNSVSYSICVILRYVFDSSSADGVPRVQGADQRGLGGPAAGGAPCRAGCCVAAVQA